MVQDYHGEADMLLAGLSPEDGARLAVRLLNGDPNPSSGFAAAAWLMGATAMRNAMLGRNICRICGCWQLEACEGGCAWSEPNLCTACDPEEVTHVA